MITELITSIAYTFAHLIHIALIIVNFALTLLINIATILTFNIVLVITAVVATAILINMLSPQIIKARAATNQFIQNHSRVFNPLFTSIKTLWNSVCGYTLRAYNYIAPIVYRSAIQTGTLFVQTSKRIARRVYNYLQPIAVNAYNGETSQHISNIVTELQIKPFINNLVLISMGTYIFFSPTLVPTAAFCFTIYYLKNTFDTITSVEADDNLNPVRAANIAAERPVMNPANEHIIAHDQALVAQF